MNAVAASIESERSAVLRELNILHTPPEKDFDELVRLASLICRAPVALIGLVDQNKYWYKSKIGLVIDDSPRDVSFCTHALNGTDVFVVPDALNDPRFKDNPLVTGSPHIRFYAGTPLAMADGLNVGTLCVIDHEPRELDSEQLEGLRTVAKQVVIQMVSRNLRQKLEQASARLENIIESQPAGILVEDENCKVILANHSVYEILGMDSQVNLVGRLHKDWCSSACETMIDPEHFSSCTLPLLLDGKPVSNQLFETLDGRWLERDYVPLKVNGKVTSHLWVYRDISDRKRTESLLEYQRAQMIETQRLSALGEMAGGLAHEINNPMTVIYGRAQHLHELAEQDRLTPDKILRYSKEIIDVTQRVMKIIKGLRSFARSGESEGFEMASVRDILVDTLEFCRQKISAGGIVLRKNEIDAELKVWCRPVQVSQILLNLINNAFDAVEALPDRWIELDAFAVSEEVVISVTDSGKGIPEHIRSRIFAPFFTTKESHRGTGLGLTISRRMAEDQGGELQLDANSPNTRFILRLPSAHKAEPNN